MQKKTKKELQAFYDNAQFMESAIWTAYNNLDEALLVLGLLKDHLKSEDFNKYRLEMGIRALFTLLIHCQSDLMDQAKIDY